MEQSIIAGNKLIMDFLGWKHHSGDVYWFPNLYPSQEHYTGETTFNVDEARFHSSWDWLMPVVEKIRNDHYIEISFYGDYNKCLIICTKADKMIMLQRSLQDNTTIEIVWQAIVEFIQWYNKEQSVKESDTSKAT